MIDETGETCETGENAVVVKQIMIRMLFQKRIEFLKLPTTLQAFRSQRT